MKFYDYQKINSESIPSNNLDVTASKKNFDSKKILCKHCKRTLENGIRCLGMCVSDDEY